MARTYTASIKTTSALTNASTLLYITAPADMVVEIISARVVAPDNDTNEQLDLGLNAITSLGTPNATTVTPGNHEVGDAASTVTSKGEVTASEPTYSSTRVIGRGDGASSLGGWHHRPDRDERIVLSPSESWGLRLFTAITAKSLACEITYREIGG